MEDIKNRLREALELRGMMPVELAKRSGVSKGAISKYLKGTIKPKQGAIGAMDTFGVYKHSVAGELEEAADVINLTFERLKASEN